MIRRASRQSLFKLSLGYDLTPSGVLDRHLPKKRGATRLLLRVGPTGLKLKLTGAA